MGTKVLRFLKWSMIRISNTFHSASSSSMLLAFTGSSSDWDALHKIQKSQPNQISNHKLKTSTEKANLQEKNESTTNRLCCNYMLSWQNANVNFTAPSLVTFCQHQSGGQRGSHSLPPLNKSDAMMVILTHMLRRDHARPPGSFCGGLYLPLLVEDL